jgi:uncharacterized protein (DUF1499 family)
MHGPHETWPWLISMALIIGCQGARPANLGAHDGRLSPCPSTPNCVSSQVSDEPHRVAPFSFAGPAGDAMRKMKEIVLTLPRTAVITDTGTYLHIESTSALFRFVDDVEFLADDAAKVIHVRSASRLGTSDLGVNRKRVERIRDLWDRATKI